MKLRISVVISDPDVEDMLVRLGPYKRAVFIREALTNFAKSEKGIKLFNRLMQRKKKTTDIVDLDDML